MPPKPHTPMLSPRYASHLHQDDFIAHPQTGRHIGPNKGYGVNHIWKEHAHELPKWGCKLIDGVAEYVASVIVHKAPIYCEFHQTRKGYRVTVLRSAKGYVILEPILLEDEALQFYSVVTAYRMQRRGHGTLVGNVIGVGSPDPRSKKDA